MPGVNYEVTDMILSRAKLYLSDNLAAVVPAFPTVAVGAAWGSDWFQLGLTSASTTFAYGYEVVEGDVQEALAPVQRLKSAETLIIETTLAQLHPDAHALAWAGTSTTTAPTATVAGHTALKIGGNNKLKVRTIGIEGNYVDENGLLYPIRFQVYRGTFALGATLEFAKSTFVGTTIRLSALADMSRADGDQLFNYVKYDVPVTP